MATVHYTRKGTSSVCGLTVRGYAYLEALSNGRGFEERNSLTLTVDPVRVTCRTCLTWLAACTAEYMSGPTMADMQGLVDAIGQPWLNRR